MNVGDISISMIKKNNILVDEEEKLINIESELNDIVIEEVENGIIKISCGAEEINYLDLDGDVTLNKLILNKTSLLLHSSKELLKNKNARFNMVDRKVIREWGIDKVDIYFKTVD